MKKREKVKPMMHLLCKTSLSKKNKAKSISHLYENSCIWSGKLEDKLDFSLICIYKNQLKNTSKENEKEEKKSN